MDEENISKRKSRFMLTRSYKQNVSNNNEKKKKIKRKKSIKHCNRKNENFISKEIHKQSISDLYISMPPLSTIKLITINKNL